MIKKCSNPGLNEKKEHVWIRYANSWLRFTKEEVQRAKSVADSNSEDTPTAWERFKFFISKLA